MINTFVSAAPENYQCDIVLLHGFSMRPADFSPFAASLQLPARFIIPAGPVTLTDGARAWWPASGSGRDEPDSSRDRDLADFYPSGRSEARSAIVELLESLDATGRSRPLILGGFSQGAMLATELLLHKCFKVRAAVLLSSTLIAISDWNIDRSPMLGLPMLIAHGEDDHDLSFAAGVRLKKWAEDGGASVTWLPFAGGHEVPFSVWRAFKRFVLRAVCPPDHDPHSTSC